MATRTSRRVRYAASARSLQKSSVSDQLPTVSSRERVRGEEVTFSHCSVDSLANDITFSTVSMCLFASQTIIFAFFRRVNASASL